MSHPTRGDRRYLQMSLRLPPARVAVAALAVMLFTGCGLAVPPDESPAGPPAPTLGAASPDASPSPVLSPAPSPTAVAASPAQPFTPRLGTTVPAFEDEFDFAAIPADRRNNPTAVWATGVIESIRVGYGQARIDGEDRTALEMELDELGLYAATTRQLSAGVHALRIEALMQVLPGSEGWFGVQCTDADGDALGGAMAAGGGYVLFRRADGNISILDRQNRLPEGARVRFLHRTGVPLSLECGVDDGGNAQVRLGINHVLVAEHTETNSALGLIDRVGIRALAEGDRMHLRVPYLATFIGP
jgi:hypothetical protein